MKKSLLLTIASAAAMVLMCVSCNKNKTSYILVYSDHDFEHAISSITLSKATEYNATLTIRPNTETDWSITVQGGIDGLTVNPTSGKHNTDTQLHVPANKGGAREGTLIITSGGCTKEFGIKQAGTEE